MTIRTGALLALCLLGLAATRLRAQASLVILVRHAEKATGENPGLTAAGERRTEALTAAVAEVRLTAVITTQFRRTRLTADPVARAHGFTATVIPATGDLDADAATIAAAINALPAGSAVLVVGHSNTLGPIIAALGGPAIEDLCDAEYATLFVLARPGGRAPPSLLRPRVGDPVAAGAVDCHGP